HHLVPTRLTLEAGRFVVYLMWRADRGYRIGRCMSMRSRRAGTADIGFRVRMNQEHGDKLWLLRGVGTLQEAAYLEAYFAATYGLPTVCFHGVGRDLAMGEEWLARLFVDVDTGIGAKRLIDDLLLHPDFPHVVPQNGVRRQSVLVTMFADRRGRGPGYHRLHWSPSRTDVAERVRTAGFALRPAKNL